jgi:RNA polymerase sigma-70 factor (ECF subfamily)
MNAAHTLMEEGSEPREALDLSSIYEDWFRPVYRWVRALGGPEADAEDLTQEVFVITQRKLPRFDGQNLRGWLYRITALTVRNYRRRRWFRSIFLRGPELSVEELRSEAAGSEELLARKQQLQRVYRLVGRMNRKWRDSFVLFEIEGHSGDEIAMLTGIPVATVRTHLHRARKQFLELMAEEKES